MVEQEGIITGLQIFVNGNVISKGYVIYHNRIVHATYYY